MSQEVGPAAKHRMGLLGVKAIEGGLHRARDVPIAGVDYGLVIGRARSERAPIEWWHELDGDGSWHGERRRQDRGNPERAKEDREHLDSEPGTPVRSANRTKPVWPENMIRLRSDQGRHASASPPG